MKEKLVQFIVWRLLSKTMIYYAAIRLISHATTGKYSQTEVPKLTAIEALDRWDF